MKDDELPAKPSELPGDRYEDLVRALTDLALTLTEDESVRDTLHSILALALRAVPACHSASVTVLDDKGQPSTFVATDEHTYELDRRQYALRDGPCLDAARRQQVNKWSLREAEQKWPEFTDLAKELGLRSYLAAGLGLEGRPLGALNRAHPRRGCFRREGGAARGPAHAAGGTRHRDREPLLPGPGPG